MGGMLFFTPKIFRLRLNKKASQYNIVMPFINLGFPLTREPKKKLE